MVKQEGFMLYSGGREIISLHPLFKYIHSGVTVI